MATLLISTYNGVDFVSVEYFEPQKELRLGSFRRVPITDEQAKLSLEVLAKLWDEQKAAEAASAKESAAEREQLTKMSALLERLKKIIRTSHHEGERENAKALYLKFAGRAFDS